MARENSTVMARFCGRHLRLQRWYFRRRLCGLDFTVVSNNCWGAHIYQLAGSEYRTPFVGLFLMPTCFLRLLRGLPNTLGLPLRFLDRSGYAWVNEFRRAGREYPIGVLGDDIEIHFLHYQSPEEAAAKWKRRLGRARTAPSRLFAKFCDRDGCTPAQIREFDQLDLPNKVCFAARSVPGVRSLVLIPRCSEDRVPDGLMLSRISERYFDSARWIAAGLRNRD